MARPRHNSPTRIYRCAKCDGTDVAVKFIPINSMFGYRDRPANLDPGQLDLECKTCGFEWAELTTDDPLHA